MGIFCVPVLAAFCPAGGQGERGGGVFLIAGVGRAFVEKHGDVRPEGGLDGHRFFGAEHHFRPVEVGLEADAFFGDFAHFGERPNLEAAGIGEDGFLPSGEIVEAAHFVNEFVARAQPEMIGISENDLGAEFVEFGRVEGFH